MQDLIFEILFIGVLILLNGYLAGTEIAVVTARKSTIQHMAAEGKKNARIFLKLKEEPDRCLATIQIGITGVSVLASAVGGAAAIEVIKPALQMVPVFVNRVHKHGASPTLSTGAERERRGEGNGGEADERGWALIRARRMGGGLDRVWIYLTRGG